MTDPPCLFLIALALLFIGRGWHRALYAPSILAAFIRESYIIVFPYYFIRLLRTTRSFWEASWRSASIAIVPLAILVGLRIVLVPDHPGSFERDLADTMGFRWRHLADQPYLFTVGAWGVLFPLLVLFPRRIPGMVRRRPEDAFLVIFFASLCVVANNTERELGYAMPAILPAGLYFLRLLVQEARLPGGAGPGGHGLHAGALLRRAALHGDRHEHVPAHQPPPRSGDGRLLDRGAAHPESPVEPVG